MEHRVLDFLVPPAADARRRVGQVRRVNRGTPIAGRVSVERESAVRGILVANVAGVHLQDTLSPRRDLGVVESGRVEDVARTTVPADVGAAGVSCRSSVGGALGVHGGNTTTTARDRRATPSQMRPGPRESSATTAASSRPKTCDVRRAPRALDCSGRWSHATRILLRRSPRDLPPADISPPLIVRHFCAFARAFSAPGGSPRSALGSLCVRAIIGYAPARNTAHCHRSRMLHPSCMAARSLLKASACVELTPLGGRPSVAVFCPRVVSVCPH